MLILSSIEAHFVRQTARAALTDISIMLTLDTPPLFDINPYLSRPGIEDVLSALVFFASSRGCKFKLPTLHLCGDPFIVFYQLISVFRCRFLNAFPRIYFAHFVTRLTDYTIYSFSSSHNGATVITHHQPHSFTDCDRFRRVPEALPRHNSPLYLGPQGRLACACFSY